MNDWKSDIEAVLANPEVAMEKVDLRLQVVGDAVESNLAREQVLSFLSSAESSSALPWKATSPEPLSASSLALVSAFTFPEPLASGTRLFGHCGTEATLQRRSSSIGAPDGLPLADGRGASGA